MSEHPKRKLFVEDVEELTQPESAPPANFFVGEEGAPDSSSSKAELNAKHLAAGVGRIRSGDYVGGGLHALRGLLGLILDDNI